MKEKLTRKQINKRLEELEEQARRNRDKWDDTPLSDWLEDEEKEEYEKLSNLVLYGDNPKKEQELDAREKQAEELENEWEKGYL